MSDQPKLCPSDAWVEEVRSRCGPVAAAALPFGHLRTAIHIAVEKALAEQDQTHSGAVEDLMARFRGLLAEQEARHGFEIETLRQDIRQSDSRFGALAARMLRETEEIEARHKREVLGARLNEQEEWGSHIHELGEPCSSCDRIIALRAELAAMEGGGS